MVKPEEIPEGDTRVDINNSHMVNNKQIHMRVTTRYALTLFFDRIKLINSNRDKDRKLHLPPPLELLELDLRLHRDPKLGLSMLLIGLLMDMMLMIHNVRFFPS